MPSALMKESGMSASKLVPTLCPYCGAGCGLYLDVKDGRAVGLEYMSDHPATGGALCPKGNTVLEVLYHPERLTQPLVKLDGGFRIAKWDEALQMVASRLGDIRQQHGPEALGFLSSSKCTNEENYLFQKLARAVFGTNNVDNCARLCHSPTVVALGQMLGSGAATNPLADLANADCIFIVGSNLAENHPIVSQWVLTAKERGATLIVADPRRTPTAWSADLFLQLAPGTDVALLNAMMRVILDEGLHDRAFIQQRTAGLSDLAASLAGLSLTEAATITGVPASSIVQAARAYARAPAGALVYAMGVTQHTTGTETVAACANLALLCGHVGRPGAGLFPLRGQNNVQGACDMGALPDVLPGYQRLDDQVLEKFATVWQGAIANRPGLTVVEMMHAAAQGRIKGMYIMGENPVVSDPNAGEVRKALRNLDFLVVQDIFLSETAELADVVLPAAAWAEKEGSYTSTERRVQWSQKAVEPPGEARPDWQIVCEIGAKAGTRGNSGELARWNYSSPASVLAEIVTVTPQYAGITAERLQKQVGGILWPCPTPEHPGTEILHQERFATADGRARFAPVRYRPPVEAVSADYPLILTTGRIGTHFNAGAMTRRSQSLSRYAPDPFVEVNPQDAAHLGLAGREWAILSTARGHVQVRVAIADGMAPGTVFVPFHFPGINDLTIEALDPASRIPEFKVAACRID